MHARQIGFSTAMFFAFAFLPAYAQAAERVYPASVDIFTDAAHPVAGWETLARAIGKDKLRYFDLSAPRRLEEEIGRDLPSDPKAAERIAKARLAKLGSDIATRFADAYRGIVVAKSYALDRYPAVVFDRGAAVVYGETDVWKAVESYRAWKTKRGDTQ